MNARPAREAQTLLPYSRHEYPRDLYLVIRYNDDTEFVQFIDFYEIENVEGHRVASDPPPSTLLRVR